MKWPIYKYMAIIYLFDIFGRDNSVEDEENQNLRTQLSLKKRNYKFKSSMANLNHGNHWTRILYTTNFRKQFSQSDKLVSGE